MAGKWNTDRFIQEGLLKHGDRYDYSVSVYEGLQKPIKIICPECGEVELPTAKSHYTRSGCFLCDQKKAKASRKGRYSKSKGNNYELQIAHELQEIGFKNVVTSRSESKRFDAKKVDLVDPSNQLPFLCQIKKTTNVPNYFKNLEGAEELSIDLPFVLFWNRQYVPEGKIKMGSKGELVMLPKEYFYKLLKNNG